MSFLWEKILRPAAFAIDAERAHEMGMAALRKGLASPFYVEDSTFGMEPIEVFGLKFPNPIGLAAGFDKNGLVVEELASLGFGFVEVGTVTAEPQLGNPKPRMFRLPQDRALINRLGFNNEGAAAVAERLGKIERNCIVGINIGRNKDVSNEKAIENYLSAFDILYPFGDYIVVNVSSPNTPRLRDLQQRDELTELLSALQVRSADFSRPDADGLPAKAGTPNAKPLLVKIAPDLNEAEIETLVGVCTDLNIGGIIATNTTISRDGLKTRHFDDLGPGGLSGKPLTTRSNEVISTIYRLTHGKLPIIGVGGVFTAQDAFDKIAAGASLVQAYTGFIYRGPTFAADVCRGLAKILADRGFRSASEAVGTGVQ